MSKKCCCDDCMNYIYDDFSDCYICLVDLDQDEMEDFLSYAFWTTTPWHASNNLQKYFSNQI